jgi:hypothetical protein
MKSVEDRASAPQWDDAIQWSHDFQEGGVIKCRFGRRGKWLVAEWPELARLTCDETGSQTQLVPYDGASSRRLAKLRGVVTVLVGDLRGGLGIHASAVAMGRHAVLLLGEANAGKSTTAAELCLRSRGRLLADDVSLLEDRRGVVHVVPCERRHYLTPESGRALGVRVARSRLGPKGKAAIVPARLATRSYPLALAAFLRFDDSLSAPQSTPLKGAQAALRVLSSLYRFDLEDRRDELERVKRLHAQAPVIEIARPRGSPSVVAEVVRALKDGHGG